MHDARSLIGELPDEPMMVADDTLVERFDFGTHDTGLLVRYTTCTRIDSAS